MGRPSPWICSGGRLTRGSIAKDRRATALHEAAHAVVAHRLGQKVLGVGLEQRGPEGSCRTRGWTTVNYKTRGRRVDPIAVGVVSLAGHEAERIAYARPRTLLPLGDLREVYRLGVATHQTLNLLGWFARRYVQHNLPAIRRVALVLNQRGSLSRRQFLAAMRAA
jgi:hypothetical protein